MTDLLTKEERETVERIRKTRTAVDREFDEEEQLEEAKDYDRLIAIIDNLSKRGVKKYSEEEVIEAVIKKVWISLDGYNTAFKDGVEYGIKECARFLGALDAIVNEEV